jgi:hypothetical protein
MSHPASAPACTHATTRTQDATRCTHHSSALCCMRVPRAFRGRAAPDARVQDGVHRDLSLVAHRALAAAGRHQPGRQLREDAHELGPSDLRAGGRWRPARRRRVRRARPAHVRRPYAHENAARPSELGIQSALSRAARVGLAPQPPGRTCSAAGLASVGKRASMPFTSAAASGAKASTASRTSPAGSQLCGRNSALRHALGSGTWVAARQGTSPQGTVQCRAAPCRAVPCRAAPGRRLTAAATSSQSKSAPARPSTSSVPCPSGRHSTCGPATGAHPRPWPAAQWPFASALLPRPS